MEKGRRVYYLRKHKCLDKNKLFKEKDTKMRSEEPNISTTRHQNQFVEDIGQSVANALFGYSNTNENQTSTNEEETSSIRPKRSAKKVQQVFKQFLPNPSLLDGIQF